MTKPDPMVEVTQECGNTDIDLWRRETSKDGEPFQSYASIHQTEGGDITICLGGLCFTQPVEEWHKLARHRQSGVSGDVEAVEIACKAFAEASGYYTPFHRGLQSVSANKMRDGMRAALKAALSATPPKSADDVEPVDVEAAAKRIREFLEVWRKSDEYGDEIASFGFERLTVSNIETVLATLSATPQPTDAGLVDELREAMRGSIEQGQDDETISLDWRLCDRILTTLQSNRNDVIEECAQVVERYPSNQMADVPVIRGCAKAIRALQSNDGSAS